VSDFDMNKGTQINGTVDKDHVQFTMSFRNKKSHEHKFDGKLETATTIKGTHKE